MPYAIGIEHRALCIIYIYKKQLLPTDRTYGTHTVPGTALTSTRVFLYCRSCRLVSNGNGILLSILSKSHAQNTIWRGFPQPPGGCIIHVGLLVQGMTTSQDFHLSPSWWLDWPICWGQGKGFLQADRSCLFFGTGGCGEFEVMVDGFALGVNSA